MSATLVWLRDDLRLDDNPALAEAAALGTSLTVVYVLDEESPGVRPLGGAAKWWLHHSLARLGAALEAAGSRLRAPPRPGRAASSGTSPRETSAGTLLWNRRYGGPERSVDAGLKNWATAEGINATSFQANLMFEPWTVRTGSGGPYKVFTPFWRACLAGAEPRAAAGRPGPPAGPGAHPRRSPARERTARKLGPAPPQSRLECRAGRDTWTPGEAGAHSRLADFVDGPAAEYGTGRDIPGVEGTSRLSPHLRFGEISPFRIWHTLREHYGPGAPADVGIFRSELGWREFCWQLLYENPDLATQNYRPEFDRFQWQTPSDDRAGGLAAGPHGLSRWSTRACASSGRPAGCTTGCGWRRRRSW